MMRAVLATLVLGISMYGQTTYYVSPSGSDANGGMSRNSAWRTLTRIRELHTGDTLLLAGGSLFSGSIHVPASGITISSYGVGRAIIDAGDGTAIDASNVSNLRISNLVLRGTNLAHGVLYRAAIDITNRESKAKSLEIDHLEISGFGLAIQVQAADRLTGIDGISIESVYIHDVGYTGISITGAELGAFSNVSVSHSDIGSITGYRTSFGVVQGSGSGIAIVGANGGAIRENVIRDSGTIAGGGESGIVLRQTQDFLVESNEVRDVHTQPVPAAVAAAIDIDGGIDHVIRYNYTHDNDGPGIRLCACTASLDDIFVHHNISQSDGVPAAIDIDGVIPSAAIVVENNTVLTTNSTALRSTGSVVATVADNLLLTQNGTAADIVTGTTMAANDYWPSAGALNLVMNGAAHSTLASWGQDPQGISGDPSLLGGSSAALMPNLSLSDLAAVRTTTTVAPSIDKAVDVPGYDVGKRDFYGGDAATSLGRDLGAYEFRLEPYSPSIEPIAARSVAVGDAIDVDVWFHDPDGTRGIVVTLVSASSGSTIRRAGGNHAIVTIAPRAAGPGTVTVRVTDETGLSDTVSFSVSASGGVRTRAVRH